MKREPSVVEVDILDLRKLECKALRQAREKKPDDIVSVYPLFWWRWGIIETRKGLCALNDEGFSEFGPNPVRPITNDDELRLTFVAQHLFSRNQTPLSISLGPKELRALPIEKRERLSEFIRKGPRYERRYREWESALSEIIIPSIR